MLKLGTYALQILYDNRYTPHSFRRNKNSPIPVSHFLPHAQAFLPDNGTFDLSFHDWNDPFNKVVQAARKKGLAIAIPKIGEVISIKEETPLTPWWNYEEE